MPTAPVPTNFACWVHTPPERVNTHVAPVTLLSIGPPMRTIVPSGESVTQTPCSVSGKRSREALLRYAHSPCADQFRLLGPHPSGAREHPRRTGHVIVDRATNADDRPVGGKCNANALLRQRKAQPRSLAPLCPQPLCRPISLAGSTPLRSA